MGRIIVWNLVTLDGSFEGTNEWDLDWHPWGDDLERFSLDQLDKAEGLLFGRKTYHGMAAYWTSATGPIAAKMNALPKAVASTTLVEATWNNSWVVGLPMETSVEAWKRQLTGDILVFGSATLVDALWNAGLVDEFRLGVVPLVLGGGTPHFKPHPVPRSLRWIDAQTFSQGLVVLRYEPSKG